MPISHTVTHALSVWQPWASLLAYGVKGYETRSWQPPADHLGTWIAIHAGATTAGLDRFIGDDLAGEDRHRFDALRQIAAAGANLQSIPRGRIIAVARLAFILRTDSECGREVLAEERALGDWSPGRCAWRLADPILVEGLGAMRGALGLWRLPCDLVVVPDEGRVIVPACGTTETPAT
jgi:hypothetical protein